MFSDIGTPNADRSNAYEELHQQLVARGMPAEAIRFMHEAKTDADKARLFAAARAGHIAVLMGSTEKMGVGTNVQARAVALYHLDCPWRPSDIAQREGRILRQGNQNPEVAIVRFVTERSFDSYMWQGVERKATFIAQLMRGRLDTREIDEIDTSALSAAEAKAISSGNPLLLEHSTIQSEVNRLRRLHRAHGRNEDMLAHTRARAVADAERATSDITGLEAAMPRITDTSGDNFRIVIAGQEYDGRADAAHALAAWAHGSDLKWAARYVTRDFGVIGRISSFDIHLATRPGLASLDVLVSLDQVPRSVLIMSKESFLDGGIGLIQRIENRLSGIPALLDQARADLECATETIAEVAERIGQPFRHAHALAQAEEDLARIETQLAATQEESASARSHDLAPLIGAPPGYVPRLTPRASTRAPARPPRDPFAWTPTGPSSQGPSIGM